MAKKVAKKEAPAAKKKAAKAPAAKTSAKTSKPVKAVKAPPKAAKPVKAPVKTVEKASAKAKALPKMAAKIEKSAKLLKYVIEAAPEKTEKLSVKPAAKMATKLKAAPSAPVEEAAAEKAEVAAPAAKAAKGAKKEKKQKLDKTGLNEDQVKWAEMNEKYQGQKAEPYTISGQFEAKTPVQHKIFGWGYILSNEYDRLEVLFEDGKRMLISNRKLS